MGILDRQQWNVAVAVTKPVPPHNVLEISFDKVAQASQVVVLPPLVRGRRAAVDFVQQCHGFEVRWVSTVLQHRYEVLRT
jgi:hypothetical protein